MGTLGISSDTRGRSEYMKERKKSLGKKSWLNVKQYVLL